MDLAMQIEGQFAANKSEKHRMNNRSEKQHCKLDHAAKLRELAVLVTALAVAVGASSSAAGDMPSGPRLGSFWIVDADANIVWDRLPFDDLIDLDHTPDPLNIIVDAEDPVGSIVFTLDGVPVNTENVEPYAMGGDNSGDYHPLTLPTGFHIIEATGYTGPNGTGDAGPSAIVSVEVGHSHFDVDTTIDAHDASPGDGVCRARKNVCSLRAAIEEANALGGRQWVHTPTGTYTLSLGTINVTDQVTVRGESANGVHIDGGGWRAFWIEALRSDFDELTIAGAHGEGGGGAFYVARGAELKLLDVVVTGNTANGGPGAGLRNDGTTTVLRSRFSDNDNSFDGICGGGVTARGGAIGNIGTLRMYRSSITDNRAIRGGGLANTGLAVISNTTFSGNLSRGGGGAIINQVSSNTGPGRLHLAFSTLTENEANVPCRGGSGSGEPEERRVGGGLYNTGVATVGSSIVAQNIDHRVSSDPHYAPDCWSGQLGGILGKLTSAGRNVWGELNGTCNLRYPNGLAYDDCEPAQVGLAGCFIQPGDQILRDKWGTPDVPLDAEFGVLVGFPVPAHSISATSPAVDFGGSLPLEFVFLSCPDSDQLHRIRPVGGAGVCDAGAWEWLQ
jgi:CSLREA domain-containing protein